jgi:hypothetical protein
MKVYKNCPVCGTEFLTHVRLIKRGCGKFCSRTCYRTDEKWRKRIARESLTQETVKELFTLDGTTGILFWRKRLLGNVHPGTVAGGNVKGRWFIAIDGQRYLRSRLVFLYVHGWLPKIVDHRDRNPLNDRPGNLRPATRTQNNANSKGRSKSGLPKGVIRCQSLKNPYQAQITVNKVNRSLGCFATPDLAHAAYLKAALEEFGEFACAA